MSDNRRREQFGRRMRGLAAPAMGMVAGPVSGRSLRRRGRPPLPGITIENVIEPPLGPVDNPGPGQWHAPCRARSRSRRLGHASLIAAGEIVVRRGQLADPAVAGTSSQRRGSVPHPDPPSGADARASSPASAAPRARNRADRAGERPASGRRRCGRQLDHAFGGHITMKAGGGPDLRRPESTRRTPIDGGQASARAAPARDDRDHRHGREPGPAGAGLPPAVVEDDANRDVLDVINAVAASRTRWVPRRRCRSRHLRVRAPRQFAPSADVVVYRALDTDGMGTTRRSLVRSCAPSPTR